VHGAAAESQVRDGSFEDLDTAREVREVFAFARGEIIENKHGFTARAEGFGKVGPMNPAPPVITTEPSVILRGRAGLIPASAVRRESIRPCTERDSLTRSHCTVNRYSINATLRRSPG